MDKLTEQLKRHEGLVLHTYECPVGKITMGYGRNLEDKGISQKEAEYLLTNDINDIKAELKRRLPIYNTVKLSKVRKAVLENMAFNLGVTGLLQFKKMLQAVDKCDFGTASKEMLNSRWARQVGNRARELSEQMRTGQWQF